MRSAVAAAVYIALTVVLSCAVSRIVYLRLEIPVTRRMRRWLEPVRSIAQPVAAPVSVSS